MLLKNWLNIHDPISTRPLNVKWVCVYTPDTIAPAYDDMRSGNEAFVTNHVAHFCQLFSRVDIVIVGYIRITTFSETTS